MIIINWICQDVWSPKSCEVVYRVGGGIVHLLLRAQGLFEFPILLNHTMAYLGGIKKKKKLCAFHF